MPWRNSTNVFVDTLMFFLEYGHKETDGRTNSNPGLCILVSYKFVSGRQSGLLLLFTRWLPCCRRYCSRSDPLTCLLFRSVTTVEHVEGHQHIADVVSNYSHGKTIGRLLGLDSQFAYICAYGTVVAR